MAKLTLLEMVQDILNSMSSDDVNEIDGNEESLQVVAIIEDSYNFILTQRKWPHLNQVCPLLSLSDSTKPNYLKIPESFIEIDKLRYETSTVTDTEPNYQKITFRDSSDFVDCLLNRKSSDANVQIVTSFEEIPLFIRNDRAPELWTSFDDKHVVFDSFDSALESTVQGTKSMVNCRKLPPFTRSNDFIPDIPEKDFPAFLSECRNACHQFLKQARSSVDDSRSVTAKHNFVVNNSVANRKTKRVNYGRK